MERLELRAMLTGVTLLELNQTPAGSDPSAVIVVGDQGFFSAGDGIHGRELWKTDGTEAGTVLVKDIQPGPSSSLSRFPRGIDVDGTFFFVADEFTHGQELWKSDGTEAGTMLVKDIYPGRESSSIQALTANNGMLYFLADDGVHGNELWKSDGTEAGTVLVKDIHPSGGQEFDSDSTSIVSFGDGVLFGASDGVRGRELWRSDGTEAGTSMVIGLLPIETDPSEVEDGFRGNLVAFGTHAFFTGYTKATGGRLYRTDGTESGTQPFGSDTLSARSIVDLAGTLYFFGDDGIYKSDGTSTGTVRTVSTLPERFDNITVVGNSIFFSAHDDTFGEQLWTSDGTEAGTVRVTEIDRGLDFRGEPMGVPILSIHDFGGVAFVVLDDGIKGNELWRSDGTKAGTHIIKDIHPGKLGIDLYDEGVVLGGQFLFPADNGTGGELWKTDGSEAGTTMIKEIDTVSTQSSNPGGGINLGNRLLISADDGVHGRELIQTDGTRSGTSLLKDIHPDGDSSPQDMTLMGDTVFFLAEDPTHGRELWKTDGTEAGTVLVRDINPGSVSSTPNGFFVFNNKLYFGARDDAHGRELWVSDGSEAGTKMLKDIRPGTGDGFASTEFTLFKGELYFRGNDGITGRELWKTDGTEAGTVLVKDFGSGSSDPGGFTVFGDSLFLTADGPQGKELYKSDGTSAGTVLVKDIQPGSKGSFLGTFDPVVTGGAMFFMADDGIHGYELWKSDGTEAGTVLLKDIEPGEGHSFPNVGVEIGGVLIFRAGQTDSGLELWRTDGTPEGTTILKDAYPGNQSSLRSLFGFSSNNVFEGELYFDADDGVHGRELWKTDGTEAGTVLVEDIIPGPEGSTPTTFAQVGGKLLFSAGNFSKYSFDNHVELYRLGVDPAIVTASMTDAIAVDVDNDGKLDPGDTLKYTTTLSVGTDADADAVLYSQIIDGNTTIVPGSVSTSQGTITIGSNGGQKLEIGFGSIPASGVVTVTYSVRVNDTLPNGVTQITNQATVSGNNFADVPTDDPALDGTTDPTSIAVQNGPAGIAPVATNFPVGNIPKGTIVSIDAVNLISEFGTDADSVLTSNSVTFGAVTIGGSNVGSIADAGFIYTPGSGPAGAFTIDTSASAFTSVAAGNIVDVVINFTVSDGSLSDTGVLTFAVSGDAGQLDRASFHFLGDTIADQEIKASAIAGVGESLLDVSITGASDVSIALSSVSFANSLELGSLFTNDMLTLAAASAANESDATATATDNSKATAIANRTSTATALAKDESTAQSVADNDSVSNAEAIANSTSTSTSDSSSAASAKATNDSTAHATAKNASAAEADSAAGSDATATADNSSVATAFATNDSLSIATSDIESSATAFAKTASNSSAESSDSSISDAVTIDGSAAIASASGGSDALAFAMNVSTATATATTASSASAGADERSESTSIAQTSSATIVFTANQSMATAESDTNSIAIGLAIEATTMVSATATHDSAARAAGAFESEVHATATGGSGADAAANAMPTTVTSSGSDPDTQIADAVRDRIAAITTEATISKAIVADLAMGVIGGTSVQRLEDVINNLIGRESGSPSVRASESRATAGNDSVSVSTAMDQSVSVATSEDNSSSTAFATTASASSSSTSKGSISNAIANDASGATATATDASDALAFGEQGSASEATSNTESSASASAEGSSNSTSLASSSSTATANSTTNSSATSNAGMSSVSNAEASGGSIATAVSDTESAASAVAKNGLDAVAKAAQKSAAEANSGSDAVNKISITTDGANVVVTNSPSTPLNGTKGASIALPIQVVESGGAAIQSIVISKLPAGSQLSSGTSNENGSEWTFSDLPPSDLKLTLPADFVGEFALDVTAKNSDDVLAKATVNGLVTAPPEIHATISDKIINDDGTGTANPGETIEYLLTVRNDGSGDALNVVIADILDPNMSLVPGSVSVNPIVANAAFPINVGTIAAGTSVTVTFRGQVSPATVTLTGSVANQARISGSNFDAVLSDDPTTRFVNDSTMTPLDHRNTVIVDGPSTRTFAGLNLATDISDDGQRIVFISNLDRTGNNADKSFELFVFDIASNQTIQVTDVTAKVNIVIQPPVTNANGSRILFVSNGDFAGENADGNEELFLVDLTATGSPRFTQITNTESGKDSSGFELTTAQTLSFSNDGTKIVFQSDFDLTGDNAGNKTEVFLFDTVTSMLIQVTGGTSGINSAFDAVISGDGTRIVMVASDEFSGGNSDRSEEIFAYDVVAKTFKLLTDFNIDQLRSDDIAISDDGNRIAILFDGDTESTVVLYDENASQPISQLLTVPGTAGTIEISGDGTTIVLVEVISNDADFSNLIALDIASKTKTKLTNVTVGASVFPLINRDGSRIAFSSTANLTGENLDANPEVFYTNGETFAQIAEIEQTPENSSTPSYSGDGTAIFFVTNGGEGVFGIRDSKLARLDLATGKVTPLVTVLPFTGATIGNPDANFDGTFIAFDSNDMDLDTLDTNEDGSREIFVYDSITEELLQVTHSQNPATVSTDPSISHDGRRVAYVSSTQGNRAAFLATLSPTGAPSISPITQSDSGDASGVVLSGDGSMVALASTGNESGNNSDANRELFVFDVTTKTLTQVTKTTGGTGGENPSSNLDGTLIAFESDRDLTGENADGNREIFLVNLSNPAVPVFTQITDTLGGANRRPQISDDGTIIVFESDRDFTGGNGENHGELYLYQVPLDMFLPIINLAGADDSLHASVSASGKKIAFSSVRNLDGQNQDGSSEIFTAEAISPEVDISIAISESVDPVNITSSAESLTYVVRVNNLGTETATGITINSSLTLPSGVSIESAVASIGSFAGSIWNLGTLSSGASATLTFTLAVSETATAGNDVIAGSAMLAAIDQFDANPANNSASVATSISREASGVLNRETVNVAKSAEAVSRAANLNIPGLNANVLEGVDLNDEAAIRTALIMAGVNADSINITVARRDDGQTVSTNTAVTFTETPGTVFTGDINNPDTITVLSGQLNVTTTITTTTTQRFTDVLTITGMLDEKAGCLTSAPLVVGENMLTYSCATPGAFVAFVIGTQPGSHFFSKYNATVDIADPTVPAIRVANIDGIAQIPFNLTAQQVQSNLRFQAFEMLPTVQVSNVLTVLSSLDISGDGRVTVMDALMVINQLPLQQAGGESESIGRPSRNYDANRDGRVSALDALTIINHVNRQSVASAEAIALSPMTSGIGFADDMDDDLDDDLLQMLADDRLRQR